MVRIITILSLSVKGKCELWTIHGLAERGHVGMHWHDLAVFCLGDEAVIMQQMVHPEKVGSTGGRWFSSLPDGEFSFPHFFLGAFEFGEDVGFVFQDVQRLQQGLVFIKRNHGAHGLSVPEQDEGFALIVRAPGEFQQPLFCLRDRNELSHSHLLKRS